MGGGGGSSSSDFDYGDEDDDDDDEEDDDYTDRSPVDDYDEDLSVVGGNIDEISIDEATSRPAASLPPMGRPSGRFPPSPTTPSSVLVVDTTIRTTASPPPSVTTTAATPSVTTTTSHSGGGGKDTPIISDMLPNNRPVSFFAQPGILAAVIGGAVVGLLCAILLVMFIVYRMRKKDEGSYILDEPTKRTLGRGNAYTKTPNKEFYA
jgi:syndecan 2